MPLTKLQFRPGISRETTSYSNEGGWFDCDKIRFRSGFPEKIGGWSKYVTKSFLGSARSLHTWKALDQSNFIGIGTHLKFYLEEGGGFYDITPIRLTSDPGDVTFSATDGSDVIEVTHTNHGARANDFVTFSGAVSLGGNITADILNQEYQVVEVSDTSTYTIRARTVSQIANITVDGQLDPTYVSANASDTGNGGASVVGTYQVNTGVDTTIFGTGWGAGFWSRGAWNSAATVDVSSDTLRLWTQDNFGEDLVFNVRDGGVYYWDRTDGTSTRGVALSDLAEASNAPVIAKQVMVSDVDRHVIAFGCNALGGSTQDPLLIRFSDQENAADWTPTATNTAGDLLIGSGSEIVCAVETRQQILVFTDISLHAMQYLGPPFTFGISMISENTSVMSPMSTVAVDDTVFWMGLEEFYVYNGSVSKLPCSVKDYVFSDLNLRQREKSFASTNLAFSEIWWFYPSASSDNIDRYVVFNYEQNIWYFGSLARTAWSDRGVKDYPIAASTDGYLYSHEFGLDDGSTNPPSGLSAYVESSQLDIGDGDRFSFVSRIIPDVTFRDSTSLTPSVTITMKARNFPGGVYLQSDDRVIEKTASVPVEQFTEQAFVRLRGRSMALRVSSDDTGVSWRLGSPRVDLRLDGKR